MQVEYNHVLNCRIHCLFYNTGIFQRKCSNIIISHVDPEFTRSLQYRFYRNKREADNIEDVYDGEQYKAHFNS